MSTTFGVNVPGYEEPIQVVNRFGARTKTGVHLDIINPLVLLLPDDTPLIPLDNTAQGIETVADLKQKIKENLET